MSATFATPVAAVMLAVELLLFEWKPRSVIPVALGSAVAAAIRPFFAGPKPLFPVPVHGVLGGDALLAAMLVGLLGGALSALLTAAVYGAEDAFERLPIHWMWWPAIGGLFVGVGGLIEPRALGVGYDTIGELLRGEFVPGTLLELMLVKGAIWAIALGSGTSGGVLAPLLIMGCSLGALEALVLPKGSASLWPLVSMATVLGGTMRSPLTSVVFALELTEDVQAIPCCLIASMVAYGFTVLVMKRSILTEKVARRGIHLTREYTVDPLELIAVKDVMTRDVVTLPHSLPVRQLFTTYFAGADGRKHQGYPVVDDAGRLVGIVTRSNLLDPEVVEASDALVVADVLEDELVTVTPEESCRTAAERMAQARVGRLPVVTTEDPRRLAGIITRSDLLEPRARSAAEEQRRERFFRLRLGARRKPAPHAGEPRDPGR